MFECLVGLAKTSGYTNICFESFIYWFSGLLLLASSRANRRKKVQRCILQRENPVVVLHRHNHNEFDPLEEILVSQNEIKVS